MRGEERDSPKHFVISTNDTPMAWGLHTHLPNPLAVWGTMPRYTCFQPLFKSYSEIKVNQYTTGKKILWKRKELPATITSPLY